MQTLYKEGFVYMSVCYIIIMSYYYFIKHSLIVIDFINYIKP
jgi:hypothetical protein